jgi:hypothetical protein
VEEIFNRIRSHSVGDVISKIWFYPWGGDDEYVINISAVYLGRVNFPDNCYTLDLENNEDVKEFGIIDLYIHFRNLENRTVKIFVQGSSLSCDRNINDNRFYSTGDEIKLDKMGKSVRYAVKMKKNVFVEEDSTKKCRNYPNMDHDSYRDCDDQWIRDYMVTDNAPGLVPIWLADTWENVSEQYVALDEYYTYQNYYDGTFLSDCPLPCTTISTETRLISESLEDDSTAYIDIAFSEILPVHYVEVTVVKAAPSR